MNIKTKAPAKPRYEIKLITFDRATGAIKHRSKAVVTCTSVSQARDSVNRMVSDLFKIEPQEAGIPGFDSPVTTRESDGDLEP